jgi:hypothetical protein
MLGVGELLIEHVSEATMMLHDARARDAIVRRISALRPDSTLDAEWPVHPTFGPLSGRE